MPSVRFTGRVLPPALSVSIPNQPIFNWKADELELDMIFQVRIQDGSIVIDCNLNKFDESAHLVPLFLRASDIARACVGLAAFATGNGLTAVLETFTDAAGTSIPLAAQHPALGAHATAAKLGTPGFDELLQVVLAEPPLFMAVHDLIEALSSPQRARVNCARAMRNVWSYFARSGSHEAVGLAMRDNLQVSRSYVQKIRVHEPDIPTDMIIERAWIVMNRFLEYRSRGGQPLPLSEFPLLV
jgi:hypothetical protein